jgi:hypothetical protein
MSVSIGVIFSPKFAGANLSPRLLTRISVNF